MEGCAETVFVPGVLTINAVLSTVAASDFGIA